MSGDRAERRGRWPTRVLLAAALALLGAVVAAYLAADQLGVVARAWDPFFGHASSQAVLHSAFSRALPVPDALIGAAAYLLECGLAIWLAVAEHRSRPRPWVRTAYGAVVVGMALAGAALGALQAFYVQSFCSLCLLSAVISWVMVPLAASTFRPGFRATVDRTVAKALSRPTLEVARRGPQLGGKREVHP